MDTLTQLSRTLSPEHCVRNEPLSHHTTLGIGGPADILFSAVSTDDLISAVRHARELRIPVTILGNDSNMLVADSGIRGLVIENKDDTVTIHETPQKGMRRKKHIPPRWNSDKIQGTFQYEFADLDYDESNVPTITVDVDSGVRLPSLMWSLFQEGITGLQWFSDIPGTIGGAVFNNIHGGTHFSVNV